MKGRTSAWGEPMQPKRNITDVDHGCTRFDTTLIGLTLAPIPPMPRVRALHHPAFLPRCAALYARGPRLPLDTPPGPMCGHPGVQRLVVILLLRTDRDETRQVGWVDLTEQARGCHAVIKTRTGQEHGEHQAQRL